MPEELILLNKENSRHVHLKNLWTMHIKICLQDLTLQIWEPCRENFVGNSSLTVRHKMWMSSCRSTHPERTPLLIFVSSLKSVDFFSLTNFTNTTSLYFKIYESIFTLKPYMVINKQYSYEVHLFCSNYVIKLLYYDVKVLHGSG